MGCKCERRVIPATDLVVASWSLGENVCTRPAHLSNEVPVHHRDDDLTSITCLHFVSGCAML